MTAMRSCRRPPDRVYGWTFGGGFQTLFKDLGEAGTPKFKRSEWTRGNAAAVEVFRAFESTAAPRSSLSNPPLPCACSSDKDSRGSPRASKAADLRRKFGAAAMGGSGASVAQRVLDHEPVAGG